MAAKSISLDDLARLYREQSDRNPTELCWKLEGLKGGATAFTLGRLLADCDHGALVIAASSSAAEEFTSELQTVLDERGDDDFLARRVHLFPDREAPPLELVSPLPEVEAGRSAALYRMAERTRMAEGMRMADGEQRAEGKAPIIVASIGSIALRTIPRSELFDRCVYLAIDDEIDLDDLSFRLDSLGYRRTGVVEEPGEMAVRGGIVDIWPAGNDYPCRCELFDNTVESLRYFDPGDQRSFGTTSRVVVLPAQTCSLSRLAEPDVRRLVADRCNDLRLAASERRELDACLAEGVRFPGVELLMSYAYSTSAWFGDYLADDARVIVLDPPAVEAELERKELEISEASSAAEEAGTFFPEIERLYVSRAELRNLTARKPLIEIDYTSIVEFDEDVHDEGRYHLNARTNDGVVAARARVQAGRGERRFAPMVSALQSLRSAEMKLVVLASDDTQAERLSHLLELAEVSDVCRASSFSEAVDSESNDRIYVVTGHLSDGFRLPVDNLTVVTDQEIFGKRRRAARRRKASKARVRSMLGQLRPGDYVVHVEHGVGLYRGLKHISVGDAEGDFIHLEYAGGDRYYLSVDRINLVEKYTGSGQAEPPLSKLGGQTWARVKKRAKDSIMVLARELLDVEAYRAVHERPQFASHSADFEEFEARFPFEETDGQKSAIADVVRDLLGQKPMDRVICGDVGYGKTEVAMRAAYLTVMGGKQAAFLVPTTILARQHFDSLRERFKDYPVEIGVLSRFNSKEANDEIVEKLRGGEVDILVGTHRMLSKDVSFKRLGMLVIDEEHRFGVKAKEKIKRLRREVDVLTMTATPIPRTLQLALTNVRDLSLIETPPVDRLAIRTYVARHDEGLIKQSIEREIARGGQVFFVHNRVASIDRVARQLKELVPKARVAVAHGQMNEGELEKCMVAFLAHEYDVLLCTSIIESGIDIPNANTIIVDRADRFGLAQLYQIRGRVGRSDRRAFAYLLVPGEHIITEDARRRLSVLQELDELGSGFRVAAHDMEIRGAGNLLGQQQSGHVAAVGFELFMQMMEEAANELRGRPNPPRIEPEIELGAEAYIPAEYIPDAGERLLLYKRLANVVPGTEMTALLEEMEDRFGSRPPEVEDYAAIMGLRARLQSLGIESLKAAGATVSLRFHPEAPIESQKLIELATGNPNTFRLRPGGVLTMMLGGSGSATIDKIREIETLLSEHVADGRDFAPTEDLRRAR